MNIGYLGAAIASRSSATGSVSDVSGAQKLDAPPSPAPANDGSARVSLSKGGELMQQLSELQQSDPAKFKQVVDQISQKFSEVASSKTGAEADGLARLANAFQKVSETGDLSALRPPQGDRGHPADVQRENGEGVSDVPSRQDGQGVRAAQAYRKNAAPPAPPPQALEQAFSQALSIVNASTGAESAASNKAVAGVGGVLAA